MQAYGCTFAKVYNALWGGFVDHVAPLIYEFYETVAGRGSKNKTLLDLCCGTGQLSVFFLVRGYRVVGLDLSENMLRYARENARLFMDAGQADFVCGDAADFYLAEKFGLVVSTFDALNHLENESALRGCFRSTHTVLADDGYFIFDLNTASGLRRWNGMQVDPDDEVFLFNRGIFDEQTVKAWTKITGFVRTEEGLFERFDETVYNTVFEMQVVLDLLLDVGFRSAHFARIADLSTPIDEPEKESRVFFVARK